jgi:hypothetical protein
MGYAVLDTSVEVIPRHTPTTTTILVIMCAGHLSRGDTKARFEDGWCKIDFLVLDTSVEVIPRHQITK